MRRNGYSNQFPERLLVASGRWPGRYREVGAEAARAGLWFSFYRVFLMGKLNQKICPNYRPSTMILSTRVATSRASRISAYRHPNTSCPLLLLCFFGCRTVCSLQVSVHGRTQTWGGAELWCGFDDSPDLFWTHRRQIAEKEFAVRLDALI